MRLRVLLLSLLVSSVALAGCSDGGGESADDADKESAEETQQRTALRMSAPSGYESQSDAGSGAGSGDSGGAGSGGSSGGGAGSGSGGGSGGGAGGGSDGGSGGGSSDPDPDPDPAPAPDPDPEPDPQPEPEPADPGEQDPLRALLGGLPLPGFGWNDLSGISGVDYEAGGFYDRVPLDLDDPRPPSGGDLEAWHPSAMLESLGAQGDVAGYGFSASQLKDGEVRHYQLEVSSGDAQAIPIRSLLLAPEDFVSYVDAGGDLTRVGQAGSALSGAAVHEDVFRVIPLVYAIEGDDGSRAQVTVYLPLDVENPADYWRPVGMAYDDGVHAGSWEFAPRSEDDRPRLRDDGGRVALPYMAGDSVEELAAWDIVLAVHGLNLYAQYPAQGAPLPDPSELPGVLERAADDPDGWLFQTVQDPTGLTDEQFYLFGHDLRDVDGLVAAYHDGLQVHHEERHEDRVQWFRVGFAPGLPVPTLIEVGSQQEGHAGTALRIDLVSIGAQAGGLVPDDLPGPDGLPGGLPLPP